MGIGHPLGLGHFGIEQLWEWGIACARPGGLEYTTCGNGALLARSPLLRTVNEVAMISVTIIYLV